ncbi:MAG: SUMF1/EgtB/PvdO family nonheme iron enzyme, partial [Acidobacteria bacterium]|nr:SUMF1/EgtB/PvdO family nonheme iron enzyme [Acidobacteriota bacterium]
MRFSSLRAGVIGVVIIVAVLVPPRTLLLMVAHGQGGGRPTATPPATPPKKRTAPPKKATTTKKSSSPAPAPKSNPAKSAPDTETVLWETVKDSTVIGDVQVYLRRYPSGRYASIARQRVSDLQAAAKKNEPEPSPPAPTTSSRRAPVTNRYGIEMAWISPGSFEMGSNNGEAAEKPAHRVTIRQGFYMGKYEVT